MSLGQLEIIDTYDYEEFIVDLEESYNEMKMRKREMTERTRHMLGERLSGTFQSKYVELSMKF